MICQFCRKKLTKLQKKRKIKVGKIVERLADYKWNYVKLYIHDFCHGGYLARKRMLEAIAPEPETAGGLYIPPLNPTHILKGRQFGTSIIQTAQYKAAQQLVNNIYAERLEAIKGEKP